MAAKKSNTSGKHPGGRPTKFTPPLGDMICSLIAEGNSLNRICSTIPEIPYIGTVLRWVLDGEVEKTPELHSFAISYKRAMDVRTEILFDQIIDIADYKGSDLKTDGAGNPLFDEAGHPIIDHDNIQRAKLQIDSRFKYASKLKPKKYGERLTSELIGDKEHPLQIEKIEIELIRPKG